MPRKYRKWKTSEILEMVRLRNEGYKWEEIGDRYKITAANAYNLVKHYKKNFRLSSLDEKRTAISAILEKNQVLAGARILEEIMQVVSDEN